jgi:hypothetical protein
MPTLSWEPQIIEFPSIGASNFGYITVSEYEKTIPFEIKRVYWTYYTPHHIERGGHAHKGLYQILVSVSGIIDVTVTARDETSKTYILNSPDKGLLLPPPYWHTMRFSHNSVLLCLASQLYDENDYIRDYNLFLKGK